MNENVDQIYQASFGGHGKELEGWHGGGHGFGHGCGGQEGCIGHGLGQEVGQVDVGQQVRAKHGDGQGQQQPQQKPIAASNGANQ